MQIILSIIGGILMFIGIRKLLNIYEVYQMFGPLLDNAWSQGMMNDQIAIGVVICTIGGILLLVAYCQYSKNNLTKGGY
jgi:uncharacterized membrane protein